MAAFSVQDAQSRRFLPVENSPVPLCSISMGGKGGGYTYYIGELPQSKPYSFASSLWEGAFGMAARFPTKVQSLRECPLPLGGAVAQRLRGYRWRSEKSVKAIAPTGAALAFLCFDFFFRIVKGV